MHIAISYTANNITLQKILTSYAERWFVLAVETQPKWTWWSQSVSAGTTTPSYCQRPVAALTILQFPYPFWNNHKNHRLDYQTSKERQPLLWPAITGSRSTRWQEKVNSPKSQFANWSSCQQQRQVAQVINVEVCVIPSAGKLLCLCIPNFTRLF